MVYHPRLGLRCLPAPLVRHAWLTVIYVLLASLRVTYHVLRVKFQHQFTAGPNLLATYRYSRTMDNGSEDFIGWASGGSWRWQVSSIIRLSSGMPLFTVVQNTWDNPLWQYGFPGNERPNLVGNPKRANQGPDNWINGSAFEPIATRRMYGNAPRSTDALGDSGARNVDLSIAKTFSAGRFNIQFRAEFFNVFNTPSFGNGNIGTCIDCGGLGQAWGRVTTRVISNSGCACSTSPMRRRLPTRKCRRLRACLLSCSGDDNG